MQGPPSFVSQLIAWSSLLCTSTIGSYVRAWSHIKCQHYVGLTHRCTSLGATVTVMIWHFTGNLLLNLQARVMLTVVKMPNNLPGC